MNSIPPRSTLLSLLLEASQVLRRAHAKAIEPGELFTGQLLIKLTSMVEKLRTTLVNELPQCAGEAPATRDLASVCQELHTATGYLRRTIEAGPDFGLEAKLKSVVGAQKSLAEVFEDGEYVIRWPDDYERTITAESIEGARQAAQLLRPGFHCWVSPVGGTGVAA